MITYEYPLNERIRTFLRLQNLFSKILYFTAAEGQAEHHFALTTLFEVLEIAGRADLKLDLIQELERQRQALLGYRNQPGVSEEALNGTLQEIEQSISSLHSLQGKSGQHLRESEWLMSIKNRTAIPGGVCEFDLPSYHYWLNHPASERQQNLSEWLAPMLPINVGASIILRLLRATGAPQTLTAQRGAYQMMPSGRLAHLIRLRVAKGVAAVPEISANKYAINIRFTVPEIEGRAKQAETDIDFELTFCYL